MKAFCLALLTVVMFVSCGKKTSTSETQQNQETPTQTQEQTPETTSTEAQKQTFEVVVKEVIAALEKENKQQLNKYVNPKTGYYFVLSTMGAYLQYIPYKKIDSLYDYSKTAGEYEPNPFKYLLEMLSDFSKEEKTPVKADLFGEEPCEFSRKGVFIDSNDDVETKLLTDIYNVNNERDGLALDSDALVELASFQKGISRQVFIGDGEAAFVLYFSKVGDKWYLSIFDLNNCES